MSPALDRDDGTWRPSDRLDLRERYLRSLSTFTGDAFDDIARTLTLAGWSPQGRTRGTVEDAPVLTVARRRGSSAQVTVEVDADRFWFSASGRAAWERIGWFDIPFAVTADPAVQESLHAAVAAAAAALPERPAAGWEQRVDPVAYVVWSLFDTLIDRESHRRLAHGVAGALIAADAAADAAATATVAWLKAAAAEMAAAHAAGRADGDRDAMGLDDSERFLRFGADGRDPADGQRDGRDAAIAGRLTGFDPGRVDIGVDVDERVWPSHWPLSPDWFAALAGDVVQAVVGNTTLPVWSVQVRFTSRPNATTDAADDDGVVRVVRRLRPDASPGRHLLELERTLVARVGARHPKDRPAAAALLPADLYDDRRQRARARRGIHVGYGVFLDVPGSWRNASGRAVDGFPLDVGELTDAVAAAVAAAVRRRVHLPERVKVRFVPGGGSCRIGGRELRLEVPADPVFWDESLWTPAQHVTLTLIATLRSRR